MKANDMPAHQEFNTNSLAGFVMRQRALKSGVHALQAAEDAENVIDLERQLAYNQNGR